MKHIRSWIAGRRQFSPRWSRRAPGVAHSGFTYSRSLRVLAIAAVTLSSAGGLGPRNTVTRSVAIAAARGSAVIPVDSVVRLAGTVPAVVLNGQAKYVGLQAASTTMSVNFGLPFRNQPALDAFLANDAQHGIYMTNEQFDAEFAPAASKVQAVKDWAAARGLKVTYASADGVTISARGSTSAVESALGVQINSYRTDSGITFYATAEEPTIPASLGVTSISGLDSYPRFHVLSRQAAGAQLHSASMRSGGYFPSDFRTAYDEAGHGYDGTGQVIGLTLWGAPVPDTALQAFAQATGDHAMTGTVVTSPSNAGADQIEWVYTNGTDSTTDAQGETAMDVEYAHGMAPHSHLVYYLGNQTGTCPSCGGSDIGLENAISMAANNAAIHVVSNSWGGDEAPTGGDSFVSITTSSFEHAVAVGTTFYFSSGDDGTDSGGTGAASYPADSPYVVSVGGTALSTGSGYDYGSESVWNWSGTSYGGGAGCSTYFAKPAWQSSVTMTNCNMRAEPDVSADADPDTGADVYTAAGSIQEGGTSLAAPLFAGMAAVADSYAAANGLTRIGWAAPSIYSLASGPDYTTDFHDVTVGQTAGSIHYQALGGWDQATGWGSIDWWNWAREMVAQASAPTPTVTPTVTGTPPTATATSSATVTPTPGSGACTADGVCITNFSASATSLPINTYVTLTVDMNEDILSTPWYVDITDGSGAVVTSCYGGSTCSFQITSSSAGSYQLYAYLSTSSTSIAGGGPSAGPITVTWTNPGATSTATATPAPTSSSTATATRTATAAPTPRPAARRLRPGLQRLPHGHVQQHATATRTATAARRPRPAAPRRRPGAPLQPRRRRSAARRPLPALGVADGHGTRHATSNVHVSLAVRLESGHVGTFPGRTARRARGALLRGGRRHRRAIRRAGWLQRRAVESQPVRRHCRRDWLRRARLHIAGRPRLRAFHRQGGRSHHCRHSAERTTRLAGCRLESGGLS